MKTANKALRNAITEACIEIAENPDDSIVDIFNESFESWGVPLAMNFNYKLDDHSWEGGDDE